MQLNHVLRLADHHQLLTTYALLTAVSLLWTSPLFLLIVLVYPAIFLFQITRRNLPVLAPLLLLLNAGMFIITAAALDMAGLPLSAFNLLLVNILLTSGAYYLIRAKRLHPIPVKQPDPKTVLAIYAVFGLAIIARVVSVIGAEVPITHDPVWHAYVAETITNNQTLGYFYPPGLHILIAFFAQSFHITSALSTLYVTNVLNALTVLVWSMVTWATTKNRVLSLLVAVVLLITPYPGVLYYTAGKNAFVASTVFIPIVFYALYRFISRSSWGNLGLLLVSTLGLFFTYYPSFAYVTLLSLLVLLLTLGYKLWHKQRVRSFLIRALTFLFIIGFAALGWMATTWDAYQGRYADLAHEHGTNPSITSFEIGMPQTADFISAAKSTTFQLKSNLDEFSNFLFPLISVSLLVIIIGYRHKTVLAIPLFVASVYGGLYVINLLLTTSNLAVFRAAATYLFALGGALAIAAAAAFVLRAARLDAKRMVLIAALIVIAVAPITYQQYRAYADRSTAFVMVDQHDREAFEWVERHVEADAGFVVDSRQHSRRSRIIFSIGGGTWLPIYTGHQITTPFHEQRFMSQTNHDHHDSYTNIADNPRSALCEFHDKGFRYYYRDLDPPSTPPIEVVASAPDKALTLVHQNPGAEIYRIPRDYCA